MGYWENWLINIMKTRTKEGKAVKVVLYNHNNIGRLYISPYTTIYTTKEGTQFVQRIFGRSFFIKDFNYKLQDFASLLENGATEEEIKIFFSQHMPGYDAESVLQLFLREGMIE